MPRIAVVDDSRLVRTFTAGALRAQGHETVEIDPISLFAVLKVLREAPVDLLLADLLMPDCPGESLVRACREDAALRDLPILVVSALREMSRLFTATVQVDGFLSKPFSPEELIADIARILEKRKNQA